MSMDNQSNKIQGLSKSTSIAHLEESKFDAAKDSLLDKQPTKK